MFLSIFVYTILLLIMYAMSKSNTKGIYFDSRNSCMHKSMLAPTLLFALIMGMRFDVGNDYITYFEAYTGITSENDRFEIGYRFLVWLCHTLNLHYVFYFAIAAFIPLFFYYKAFAKQPYLYPLLTLFLFLNNEYWNWMNVMRCSISISLFVYSVNYIASHDFKRYYLFAVIALLFHKSSVLLFLIYPLFLNDVDYLKNRYVQIAVFLVTFVLAAAFEDLFFKYADVITWYQEMLGGEDNSYHSYSLKKLYEEMGNAARSHTGLVRHFKNIVWLLIIFYSPRIKSFYNDKKIIVIYTLFFIGSILKCVIPEGAISLSRPFRFFGIFQTIMYAYFLFFLSHQKADRICKIIYLGLISAFIVIFYMNMALSDSKDHIWYQFFWSNPRG